MKTRILILYFLLFSINLQAQLILSPQQVKKMTDCYRLGTKELMSHHYQLADSLLKISVHIRAYPSSLYNYSIVRLYLGDTATFCSNMRTLSLLKQKDAVKLYYDYCATADTAFYDRKYERRFTKKRSRYTKITINDRFLPYQMVYFLDKRKPSGIIPSYNLGKFIETNFEEVYRLYPNGDTVYTYILGTFDMDKNLKFSDTTKILIDSTKKLLKLKQVRAEFQFIVDKKGNIIHDTIINTNAPKSVRGILRKKIGKIFITKAKYNPLIYKHQPVMFCIDHLMTF